MSKFSRPTVKEMVWVTLILTVACIVISITQYEFVLWQTQKDDYKNLQSDATSVNEQLRYKDLPDLQHFNKAYIDAGPYMVLDDNGTVISISPDNKIHTPNFLPHVQQLPWLSSATLGKIQKYKSPLGEDWLLVTKAIGDGYGVVGLSQYDNAEDREALLIKNASLFPDDIKNLNAFKPDNIDAQISYVIVDKTGKLLIADSRIPLHVDPLILGHDSVKSGYKDLENNDRYYILYSPVKNNNGESVGEIIGYEDVTGEITTLSDMRQFSLMVGALSFLLFFGLFIFYISKHETEKRELRGAFQKYFSPQIMEAILREPGKLKDQRREITVMFSDIRSFTSLSEKMPVDKMTSMLQEYFDEMTDEVIAEEGVVDKFIGDGIMAFWGAPLDQPDQADRALRAAKGMIKRLDQLKAKWAEDGAAILDIGIAVNLGVATVGNFGSKKRSDYTVIGDVVNVASRLEGLNKKFNSHIIISEATKRQLSEKVTTRDLGWVDIPGHNDKVHVHEVLIE